jgi:hypothetical protein
MRPGARVIADWAAAARRASREPAAARASALAATATLAERGERYTAARLDFDFAM